MENQMNSNQLNKIIDDAYEASKVDGGLHKTYTPWAIKTFIQTKLLHFISTMENYGFKIIYSDNIDYEYPDNSKCVPEVHFIDTQKSIEKLKLFLKSTGKNILGLYSFRLCSQLHIDDSKAFNIDTKYCVRFHAISECIGMTRKINQYYNALRPEHQKQIKNICDIHRRAQVFISQLQNNNITIEYTKQSVPCFLVNNKPVIAREYIIPMYNLEIQQMVKQNFVYLGVKKVIISQVHIGSNFLDKDLNVYQRFVIHLYVAEPQYIMENTNSMFELSNENTLNVTITPDDKIQHIHVTIQKNR